MFEYKNILPETADNNYQGSMVAFYGFVFFTLLMTARSIIHMFLDDAGINVIAGIISFVGEPDPNKVIYLFGSLWGFQQVIFCFICIIVLFKYRSLIPFMCGLFLVEWTTRLLIYPQWRGLGTEYYAHAVIPPGVAGAPFVTVTLMLIFLFALKKQ